MKLKKDLENLLSPFPFRYEHYLLLINSKLIRINTKNVIFEKSNDECYAFCHAITYLIAYRLDFRAFPKYIFFAL